MSLSSSTTLLKDIPYPNCTDPCQKLDVYIPQQQEQQKSVPWIVFVHGGAWISNTRDDFQHVAEQINRFGHVCIVLGYRLSNKDQIDPETQWPRHLEDVTRGIDYVLTRDFANVMMNAMKRKTSNSCSVAGPHQRQKVILMGHSAGAQLVSLYAFTKNNSSISSDGMITKVIGVEGIYDIPKLLEVFPGYQDWFISKVFSKSQWEEASPTRFLLQLSSSSSLLQQDHHDNSLQWVIVHSKQDELVDTNQSSEFVQALQKVYSDVDFILLSSEDNDTTTTSCNDYSHDGILNSVVFYHHIFS